LGRIMRLPGSFRAGDQVILWVDLMARHYAVYKGLQKPLIYKGAPI